MADGLSDERGLLDRSAHGAAAIPPAVDIQLCTAEDEHAWNQYLITDPRSSFLHRFEWGGLISERLGHRNCFFAARSDGEICGVLPAVFFDSRIFGRFLCSMPFVDYAGPIGSDEATELRLLLAGRDLVRQLGGAYFEVRSREPLPATWPSQTHKNLVSLDLRAGSQAVWDGFKSKHRTNIRRSYKNGVTCESGHIELLDDFYTVLSASWRRLGSPFYARGFFVSLLETFSSSTTIFVVRRDGVPIAAALNGYHNARVDGLWLGMLPEARALQVGYVLYWEMIKHACESGCSEYSLGRSTSDSSAEAFKRKWNTDSRKLHWTFLLEKNERLPEPSSRKTHYRAAVEIWKRLPMRFTNQVGPALARHFP